MTGSHKGNRWLVGTGMVAAAALLVLASCQVDRPTGLAPSVDAESSATMSREALVAGPTFTPYTDRPMLTNRQEYGTFLQQNYPPMLRDAGIGGTTILWVFIDEDGTVGNSRIVEGSGYPELDAVAQRAMGVARFTPAQYDAEPVPVWVQIPVTFQTAQ